MQRREFIRTGLAAAGAAAVGVPPAQAVLNPGIEWGIYNRPWRDVEWADQLDSIRKAGFINVGLMVGSPHQNEIIRADHAESDVAQWSGWLAARGMKAISAWFSPDLRTRPVIAAVEKQKPVIKGFAALGVRYLMLGGTGRKELVEPFYEYMQHLADLAEQIGIELHLKPHDGITPSGAATAKVIRTIDRKCVKISYDPGNILYYEGLDPVAELKDCVEYVASMCVKDCIRESKEHRTVDVTPGDGMVDFKGVFDVLAQQKFAGPCVIETLGGNSKRENVYEAHRAMLFLQQFGPWKG